MEMIDERLPKNKHEKQVCEVLTKYCNRIEYMGKSNTLHTYTLFRSFQKNTIFLQPPYKNIVNNERYSDIAFYMPNKGIDCRIEVKSLETTSEMKNFVYPLVRDVKHIPEKELILTLFGKGYDNEIMVRLKQDIESEKLPITIIRSIKQFEKYMKRKM